MKPIRSAPVPRSLPAISAMPTLPACGAMAPTMRRSGITARSCATRIATASLPARLCASLASSIILMATAVEEIASMKPITIALVVSPLASCATSVVAPVITTISPIVTPTASGNSARNDCSRSSMPRMKSSMRTPRSASVSIDGDCSMTPKPVGPSVVPTRMKPTTAGSRSRFIRSPASTAASSIKASAVRSCGGMRARVPLMRPRC